MGDSKDRGWDFLTSKDFDGNDDDGSWGTNNDDGSGSFYGADGSSEYKDADDDDDDDSYSSGLDGGGSLLGAAIGLGILSVAAAVAGKKVGVQVHRMKKITMKQNQKIFPMILMKENINVKKNSKDMPLNNNGKRKLA